MEDCKIEMMKPPNNYFSLVGYEHYYQYGFHPNSCHLVLF